MHEKIIELIDNKFLLGCQIQVIKDFVFFYFRELWFFVSDKELQA
jgi:hypothetical protein